MKKNLIFQNSMIGNFKNSIIGISSNSMMDFGLFQINRAEPRILGLCLKPQWAGNYPLYAAYFELLFKYNVYVPNMYT